MFSGHKSVPMDCPYSYMEQRQFCRIASQTRNQAAFPADVSAVRRAAAKPVGNGVHRGVCDELGEISEHPSMSMAVTSNRGMASMSGVRPD